MESHARTSGAAVRSLLRRGDDALAAEDWSGAADYYNRALEADDQNPELYLRMFLADHHLLGVDELRGVATQIVAETPAERTNLSEVLLGEMADGQAVDAKTVELLGLELAGPDEEAPAEQAAQAEGPSDPVAAVTDDAAGDSLLPPEELVVTTADDDLEGEGTPAAVPVGAPAAARLIPRSSYSQRLHNLKLLREAFERTFEDDYWWAAYDQGGLEQRRHMERARADADEVFDEAFAEERVLLSSMCERAKTRIPRIERITDSALGACDDALASLEQDSGERRQEVSTQFSYLGGNLRTAHACLWLGIALVAVSVVLLALAIIPRGASVQNNTFAAFPEYFVPLGIVVGLIGVGLLVLRSMLVRSNRRVMDEHQASLGAAKTSIVQDTDLLNDKIAAVRSRCRTLEGFSLDASDEEFEAACADLDAAVKALGK